jgi:hypothetical protein
MALPSSICPTISLALTSCKPWATVVCPWLKTVNTAKQTVIAKPKVERNLKGWYGCSYLSQLWYLYRAELCGPHRFIVVDFVLQQPDLIRDLPYQTDFEIARCLNSRVYESTPASDNDADCSGSAYLKRGTLADPEVKRPDEAQSATSGREGQVARLVISPVSAKCYG